MAVPHSPREVAGWASTVQSDLARILARSEKSRHRVLTLSDSFTQLQALSVRQDSLFRESLRCIEFGLYRPAHVAIWAAFVDFCHQWGIEGVNLMAIQTARPKWTIKQASDFRLQTDFALFEAFEAAGLITKTTKKALHGLLNKRNECAHPEEYDPGINDTLGYADELMKRIAALQRKSP